MTDLDALDLAALNSATKYPPIPTYHEIDRGILLDKVQAFSGDVVLTEKVDGTNARIVVFPDGDYAIGSREDLLHAKGDRIVNPVHGIVPALCSLADRLAAPAAGLRVYFFEVYGDKITKASEQYTGSRQVGFRLFDVAAVDSSVLELPAHAISSWREHGGQQFLNENELALMAADNGVELTPRVGTVAADQLPTGLAAMQEFLATRLPGTRVALDDGAGGRPEGIVLRSTDRSVIAKARAEDYARTMRRLAGR
ncbi:RNA ligase family protein [Streptomyces marianii]|uniref:RNA ligase family protein n=1 Tax=Streptomyces marianii TaxID=1817406 RepID=UPI0018F8BEAC|nr:RNA ligase family protein [Streptomyces marianii]